MTVDAVPIVDLVEGLRWMRISAVLRAWIVVDGVCHLLEDVGELTPRRLAAVGMNDDGGAWWVAFDARFPLRERCGNAPSMEEARAHSERVSTRSS